MLLEHCVLMMEIFVQKIVVMALATAYTFRNHPEQHAQMTGMSARMMYVTAQQAAPIR
jgi:hypothetical protein